VVLETRTINRLDGSAIAGGRPSETYTTGYLSNYLGQLEGVTYMEDGEEVRYSYDRGGLVKNVTGYKGSSVFRYVNELRYDEHGQRVYIEYGNGVKTRYEYDPARRWLKGIATEDRLGRETYQEMSYRFDAVGNVLGYENMARDYGTSQEYGYDGLYQLIRAEGRSSGARSPSSGLPSSYENSYAQEFAFDAIGNMTTKTSTSRDITSDLNYSFDYEYYAGTHKVSRIGDWRYEYDLNGNLVAEVYGQAVTGMGTAGRQLREDGGIYSTDYGFGYVDVTGTAGGLGSGGTAGERREYSWNERNLLRSSVNRRFSAEYRYGADGERAVKFSVSGTARSETLYFNRMRTVSRLQGYETESKHIYVGEARIATKQRDVGNAFVGQEMRQVYYYHTDHLGSTQLVTDWDGKIYEHLEYTPYGELWVDHAVAAVGQNPTVYRFSGKEMDEETGFYYYGARYLDPRTSRWISADPAMGEYVPQAGKGADGLQGMGGVFNCVNLHVYHYAGNNPVKYVDPDGRSGKSTQGRITVAPRLQDAWALLQNTTIAQSTRSRFSSSRGPSIDISGATLAKGTYGLSQPTYMQTTWEPNPNYDNHTLSSVQIFISNDLELVARQVMALAHELGHAIYYLLLATSAQKDNGVHIFDRGAEYAAFKAQFNTASQLINEYGDSEYGWSDALSRTLPHHLKDAFELYNFNESFDENMRNRAFNTAFNTGVDAYMASTYHDGRLKNE
jgi:RHS repeat-associated protein